MAAFRMTALVAVAMIAVGAMPASGITEQELVDLGEKESKEDEESYSTYKCWCDTNRKLKTDPTSGDIPVGKAKIVELETKVEADTGKLAATKAEIEALKADIAEDEDAIATATAMREKEEEAFLAQEKDMKETLALLKEAIEVLSKVQFLQKGKAMPPAAATALVQVKNVLQRHYPGLQNFFCRTLCPMCFGAGLGARAQDPAGSRQPRSRRRHPAHEEPPLDEGRHREGAAHLLRPAG